MVSLFYRSREEVGWLCRVGIYKSGERVDKKDRRVRGVCMVYYHIYRIKAAK